MNLIGISGKMNSGKDTIGLMMQYLIMKSRFNFKHLSSIQDFNSYLANKHNHQSSWQIKKFATKVKEVCSILTGIPIEDFEKIEVKNSYLTDEWNYFVGTNKEADKAYGLKDSEYTNPCATVQEAMDKISVQRMSNKNYNVDEKRYTVRQLLQLVGTDAIRDVIHPNAWVNALFADYKLDSGKVVEPISDENKAKFPVGFAPHEQQYFREPKYPNWIITDVRFPNEFNAIRDRKGIVVRVDRPDTEISTHSSETSLDDAKFDYEILNNSDLEYLLWQVRMCLMHYQMI